MISKCLSCGYIHHQIELNCSNCSSFYTEIIQGDLKETKPKMVSSDDKIKENLKPVIPLRSLP